MRTYRFRKKIPCAWCGLGTDAYTNVFNDDKIRPDVINTDPRFDLVIMAWKIWQEDRSAPWLISRPKVS